MTHLKYLLSFSLLLLTSVTLVAQNASDALRYSWFDPTGTARHLGAGSALGALGSDFSVMSTNPAGIAWIRKTQLTFSPGLSISNADAVLTNDPAQPLSEDTRIRLNIPNAGVVACMSSQSMETFNFGVGITRIADFTDRISYDGSSPGSIVQRYSELANTFGLEEPEAAAANATEILIEDNGIFFTDYTGFEGIPLRRSEEINRRGGIAEITFGFAGNVENRVLWGFVVGSPQLNFSEERTYRETDETGTVPGFETLEIRENLVASGTGLNAKFGLIVRASQAVRVGAAIHTPTFFQIDEDFSTTREYDYNFNGQAFFGQSMEEGGFNYRIRTPWRLSGSAGVIIQRKGFLSAEVEYVNYASNQFQYEGFSEAERIVNQEVSDSLSTSLRLRLGGEFAHQNYRFRAGYGTQNSPITSNDDRVQDFSLGVGLQKDSYSIDLGYRRSQVTRRLVPYVTSTEPLQLAEADVARNTLILTFGVRLR
ncbi:MAG: hypothetical protein AAGJ82_08215 [Bacteroidota bacterium]